MANILGISVNQGTYGEFIWIYPSSMFRWFDPVGPFGLWFLADLPRFFSKVDVENVGY